MKQQIVRKKLSKNFGKEKDLEEIKKVKSVSEKLYNHVYKIVDDLVDKSCIHVGDMLITTETFKLFAEITYDEYKISMLGKTIAYALHLAFDIDESLMLTEVKEAIVNIFKFKHYYDPKSNEAFIQSIASCAESQLSRSVSRAICSIGLPVFSARILLSFSRVLRICSAAILMSLA